MRSTALLLATLSIATIAQAQSPEQLVEQARERWSASPYGPMLGRILPPTFEPRQLPAPGSPGAGLIVRYCVQCHNLPNPAMHVAPKWPGVVGRMVFRMKGEGNMGVLMRDMMAGVSAPSSEEAGILLAYLQKYAQTPLDPKKYPAIDESAGLSFKLACQQCHELPDPKRHTAAEWPAVVARMQKNMAWMNRIVGSSRDPREPQLRVDEINAFLIRYARKG